MAQVGSARSLGKLCAVIHNITYYAPEMRSFRSDGLGYWDAYLAYRSAPLGQVPASVVTATFYNFAPARVETAIPAVWDHITPAAAIARRDSSVQTALDRVLGARFTDDELIAAADLVLAGIGECDVAGRPLFAAHVAMPAPTSAQLRLHHAVTLWREHRGDAHNIALASAGIDGIECHVLLASKGVASQPVIERLRGWTGHEWKAAAARLIERGIVGSDGTGTPEGQQLRSTIESDTDRLANEPIQRLGTNRAHRLAELLTPIAAQLVDTGAVSPTWPPPAQHP